VHANPLNNPQGVGSNYNRDQFISSQKKGWLILEELKNNIQIGMTEAEARKIYAEVLKKNHIEKNWHPPKIRFGPNSVKSFRQESDETYRIKDQDIFFLDIGPIINGYEADIGKTFILNAPSSPPTALQHEYQKIIEDAELIFVMTKDQFLKNKTNGKDLYHYAETEAKKRGWILIDEGANGHRIGDFPHHVHYKGNLKDFPEALIPGLWILEIQLNSLDRAYGSFFEDVL
jgi:Xaa-Pro aminopeptidase